MNLAQRQIHLDFHTSPFIPDVAIHFDASEFARTMQDAHVDSVTVFAKCHHGMCYYPTQTGTRHPAIGDRDLLGEQIEALHRLGIRAPIYTTIVWEEDAAARFPQWRQMRHDGTFAGTSLATDNSGPHPGAWKWLNFLNPEYQDYFEAHLREIVDRYGSEVDGFFMDILMMHPTADWSKSGLEFRRRHSLCEDNLKTQMRFESEAQRAFTEKFTHILSPLVPEATLFYNSGAHLYGDSRYGVHARLSSYTHYEIESLPSGFWGYSHFPRSARLVSNWNQNDQQMPWLAMTGRFQRQWGDFGGIKPQPALEYECFRAQALGGANSVGDQLPPRGVLDPAAYQLIGNVYAQCKAAEPFYIDSGAMYQVAIVCSNDPSLDEIETGKSEEGAVQLCEELHYDCAVVDDSADLSPFELVILPDSVMVTPRLKEKLKNYHAAGGKLLLSYRAGWDSEGSFALDFLPLTFEGETESHPTYWRANASFDSELAVSDRVFYASGMNLLPTENEILIQRVLPYFQRTDVTFSSHFQTPPVEEAGTYPASVAGENFIYFADPLFREVRQTGNLAARQAWNTAMRRLIGAPLYGEGLPSTVLVYPRRRGDDLILTLLHYIPVRKSLDIDVIDERMGFAGLKLKVAGAKEANLFGGESLQVVEEEIGLPIREGRLLIEVPAYFARQ